jgi:YegS/Rv2252/BmrU family lipid kinase
MGVAIIVNPQAGGGRADRLLPQVEAALRAQGTAFTVQRTHSIEHGRELARAARDAGDVVAAFGGDGLVGAVAGELCGGAGTLAVLPGGRGNDFARKLGIGGDPVAACDVIAAGRERTVDVARVDGKAYLGIASAGLDSVVNEIALSSRLKLGSLIYAYGTVRALASWRPAHWQVVVDGEAHAFDGYSVAVANSGVFGGGMYLVPDAQLDDGLLDVVLMDAMPKRRYLANLPRVFKGTHVDEPGLHFLRGREVAFHADRPFRLYADGDPIAELPATVRVSPGALRVLAP